MSMVSPSPAARAASASVADSTFAARLAFADVDPTARAAASCAAVALAADARASRASARWAAALSTGSTLEALAGWSVDARSAALAWEPVADAADEAALLSAPADDAAAPEED
jgi:hypothetical protein